jgi:hypothetical protein
MTLPTAKPTEPGRIPAGYAAIWGLFTDWGTVTGVDALPADPGTVVAFLMDCPCAPATRRRRVAAIDHHHATAGLAKPGESAAVRAQLGRPTGDKPEASPDTVTAVDKALRALPSHGWTQGMFGRRDRCLLVLSQLARVPYQHLATLTVGDITINDGAAVVTTTAGAWMVAPADDPVLCGSCAVVRWLRVLDLVMTKPGHRHLARVVGKASAVAAADRPVGLRAVPGATTHPALAVPPGPGPPGRGPRRAPTPTRRS